MDKGVYDCKEFRTDSTLHDWFDLWPGAKQPSMWARWVRFDSGVYQGPKSYEVPVEFYLGTQRVGNEGDHFTAQRMDGEWEVVFFAKRTAEMLKKECMRRGMRRFYVSLEALC